MLSVLTHAIQPQVSHDVDGKASVAQMHNLRLFKQGGVIGPCGRWQWSNGKLRRGGAVVWSKQCLPADPHHFLHDKASTLQLKSGSCYS